MIQIPEQLNFIISNWERTENASNYDLLKAIHEYSKHFTKVKCTPEKRCIDGHSEYKDFTSIDGGFCPKCGVVLPF